MILSFVQSKHNCQFINPQNLKVRYKQVQHANAIQIQQFMLNIFYFFIIISSTMSFENTYGPDGSININVIPSFGRIVQIPETQQSTTINELNAWKTRKGVFHEKPADFDPTRYVSFSVKEVVEDPVDAEHIHQYVEQSRLSKRLGF